MHLKSRNLKEVAQRIAILAQGSVARRFLQSLSDFNREQNCSMTSLLFYPSTDQNLPYVRSADESVPLTFPTEASLQSADFISALREQLCLHQLDRLWIGQGALSDSLPVMQLCEELKIKVFGSIMAADRLFRDRIQLKNEAVGLEIPYIPWVEIDAAEPELATRKAEILGFPLFVKSALKSSSSQLVRVDSALNWTRALKTLSDRMSSHPRDHRYLLEKVIEPARHISVPVVVDRFHNIRCLGIKETILEQNLRPVLEEMPAVGLSYELSTQLNLWAGQLLANSNFVGIAEIEFLLQQRDQKPLLLNAKSSLEGSLELIESYTAMDLMKEQINLNLDGELRGEGPQLPHHVLAACMKAQDQRAQQLVYLKPASGPGIRWEAYQGEGQSLAPWPCIGQILSSGQSRLEALLRLQRATKETKLVIKDGAPNKGLVLARIQQEIEASSPGHDIKAGAAYGREMYATLAALEAYMDHHKAEQEVFLKGASQGRPTLHPESHLATSLDVDGENFQLRVCKIGPDRYQVRSTGAALNLSYRVDGAFERCLRIEQEKPLDVLMEFDDQGYWIEIEGISQRVKRSRSELIRAPGPGVIQNIAVVAGERIAAGERLLTLEAMKMELAIAAPFAGTVQRVFALANTPALRGTPLFLLQPTEDDRAEEFTETCQVKLNPKSSIFPERSFADWDHTQTYLRAFMLGYDVDSESKSFYLESYRNQVQKRREPETFAFECKLFEIFIRQQRLFRKQTQIFDDELSASSVSEDHLITFMRTRQFTKSLPKRFQTELELALAPYYQFEAPGADQLHDALYWLFKSKRAEEQQIAILQTLLEEWQRAANSEGFEPLSSLQVLQELLPITQNRFQGLWDLCLQLKHDWFVRPLSQNHQQTSLGLASTMLTRLETQGVDEAAWQQLHDFTYPLGQVLTQRLADAAPGHRPLLIELLLNRYYRLSPLPSWELLDRNAFCIVRTDHFMDGKSSTLLGLYTPSDQSPTEITEQARLLSQFDWNHAVNVEWIIGPELPLQTVIDRVKAFDWPDQFQRITLHTHKTTAHSSSFHTLVRDESHQWNESAFFKNFHPSFADRLQLMQWQNFDLERLPSHEAIFLFRAVARKNPKDERLVAIVEVRDLTGIRDTSGRLLSLPHLEQLMGEAFAAMRAIQMQRPKNRLHWNLIELRVWPVLEFNREELFDLAMSLARGTEHLGLEKVIWRGPMKVAGSGPIEERVLEFSKPSGMDLTIRDSGLQDRPIPALTEYDQKVLRLRQRSLIYPYELIRTFCPDPGVHSIFPRGSFQEFDLVGQQLEPVHRPYGLNTCNIVVGTIVHVTERYPEGIQRVVLLGDPSRGLGNLSEPECRRIMAAIDLAEKLEAPMEWFALSSGAKIAMDSGTENMDWIAAVLRRIIEFTQAAGEMNVVVMGINVGAQPYWNAEATMLMHTKGILVMLPHSAMVLTGKRALDYSGGVSAEDDLGIGGYSRVMGLNGQAQYFAHDVAEACSLLLKHYELCYVAAKEKFPRPIKTGDAFDRDICLYPHGGNFATVGQVFDDAYNPGRKKPFEIRQVMNATIDQDSIPLERWADMRDAEIAVVWDAQLGGYPVCLLGIESKPLQRRGPSSADGPEHWTGGTLFPMASKKIARAINAASGSRPVVVLANLSGFDGSPESMRNAQLEFGAEIGRAVVNFQGPVIFCVVSRFHGGAYVVFSKTLNDNLQILALEGTYASVIGGAPAAGVVFAGEVEQRTQQEPSIAQLNKHLKEAAAPEKKSLFQQLETALRQVRAATVGKIAEEFDHEHSVHRALKVGSLQKIIAPQRLRPELIEALERGIHQANQ